MNKFHRIMDNAMYDLVKLVETDDNIKEYLWEVYGCVVEDDTNLCIIQYIADYYNATEKIVDSNT